MSTKANRLKNQEKAQRHEGAKPAVQERSERIDISAPEIVQRDSLATNLLTPADALKLQRAIGNRATKSLIQARFNTEPAETNLMRVPVDSANAPIPDSPAVLTNSFNTGRSDVRTITDDYFPKLPGIPNEDSRLGLRIVELPTIEAKVNEILKAPIDPAWEMCKKVFNENPRNATRMLESSHFRDNNERLMFARCYFELSLGIGGNVDPVELFGSVHSYEVEWQRRHSDLVVHIPLTEDESKKLQELREKRRIALAEIEAQRAKETDVAHSLSDAELLGQIDTLREQVKNLGADSLEYESMMSYIGILEGELLRRPIAKDWSKEGAYPRDISLLSTYLIRGGYIKQVSELMPAAWRTMSEEELTTWLDKRFTEEEIKMMFLEKYDARAMIKASFRKMNIISALVIGLIWAKDNIARGEWAMAAAKISGSGLAAYAFNRVLYARDVSAQALMERKVGEFGRWFAGAARSNRVVNFLTRRVATALLIWDLKDFLMSGGPDGPNIPFDIIETIDINDPSSWEEPDQTWLDLGFNIWYRQAYTPETPEAMGGNLYLGKIEGNSLLRVVLTLGGGFGPYKDPALANKIYRIEGELDDGYDFFIFRIRGTQVSASDNILVISTGEKSGSEFSGTGHYEKMKVIPANQAALDLLGGPEPQGVRDSLLHQVKPDELTPAGGLGRAIMSDVERELEARKAGQ